MKEELEQHLLDIINDSKDSPLPLEVAVVEYAKSLLSWFESKKK